MRAFKLHSLPFPTSKTKGGDSPIVIYYLAPSVFDHGCTRAALMIMQIRCVFFPIALVNANLSLYSPASVIVLLVSSFFLLLLPAVLSVKMPFCAFIKQLHSYGGGTAWLLCDVINKWRRLLNPIHMSV